MRAVIQRVNCASVKVDGAIVGAIDHGLLVFLGAGSGDKPADLDYIVNKTVNLRIFADDAGKMNRSVLDVDGGVLAISQFTLYGDSRKGRRPSFVGALEPDLARAYYQQFLERLRDAGVGRVAAGIFAADMLVSSDNNGPITMLLDSSRLF